MAYKLIFMKDFDVLVPNRHFIKEGFIEAVDATSLRPPKTFKNTKTWRYFLFNGMFKHFKVALRSSPKRERSRSKISF